jgi:hypothetical protein
MNLGYRGIYKLCSAIPCKIPNSPHLSGLNLWQSCLVPLGCIEQQRDFTLSHNKLNYYLYLCPVAKNLSSNSLLSPTDLLLSEV